MDSNAIQQNLLDTSVVTIKHRGVKWGRVLILCIRNSSISKDMFVDLTDSRFTRSTLPQRTEMMELVTYSSSCWGMTINWERHSVISLGKWTRVMMRKSIFSTTPLDKSVGCWLSTSSFRAIVWISHGSSPHTILTANIMKAWISLTDEIVCYHASSGWLYRLIWDIQWKWNATDCY